MTPKVPAPEARRALIEKIRDRVNLDALKAMGLMASRVVDSLLYAIDKGLIVESDDPEAVVGLAPTAEAKALGMSTIGHVLFDLLTHTDREETLAGFNPQNETVIAVHGAKAIVEFMTHNGLQECPQGCDLFIHYIDGQIETVWCMSARHSNGKPISADFSCCPDQPKMDARQIRFLMEAICEAEKAETEARARARSQQ